MDGRTDERHGGLVTGYSCAAGLNELLTPHEFCVLFMAKAHTSVFTLENRASNGL